MKFVSIFGDSDCLLSVKGDNEAQDEFSKIFDQWTDIEYLDRFFTTHKKDLERPFWERISIEQAIIETRNEAIKFRKYLKRISEKPIKERIPLFVRLFQPLSKNQVAVAFLDKKKAYGRRNKTWLRIYALKAGADMYIITGGAIKLTDNMGERAHTNIELKKLETCKQFLLNEGLVDEEGVIELLEL
jgi:hypothetical protein